jgi:hypothetical protein
VTGRSKPYVSLSSPVLREVPPGIQYPPRAWNHACGERVVAERRVELETVALVSDSVVGSLAACDANIVTVPLSWGKRCSRRVGFRNSTFRSAVLVRT